MPEAVAMSWPQAFMIVGVAVCIAYVAVAFIKRL